MHALEVTRKWSLLSVLFFLSCGPLASVEIKRSTAPNALIDAVWVERQTDATVATPTEVYLVSRGKPISNKPVFRCDQVKDMKLTWLDENTLKISASEARVFLNESSHIVAKRSVKIEYLIEKTIR